MDLLVVGGGPAGLASALHAARAGLDVAVWEQRAGTVDKACGEGLMPGAVTALAALGLHPPGHALRGIRYVAERHRVDADFAASTASRSAACSVVRRTPRPGPAAKSASTRCRSAT